MICILYTSQKTIIQNITQEKDKLQYQISHFSLYLGISDIPKNDIKIFYPQFFYHDFISFKFIMCFIVCMYIILKNRIFDIPEYQ